MNSVQRPDAPQAQMFNRMGGQQLGNQISSAYQNSPMAGVFNPIFDRAGAAMNQTFAPITSAIQNRQAQPQIQPQNGTQTQPTMPSQPMPVLGMSQPSQPMGQFPNAMRALWGRR